MKFLSLLSLVLLASSAFAQDTTSSSRGARVDGDRAEFRGEHISLDVHNYVGLTSGTTCILGALLGLRAEKPNLGGISSNLATGTLSILGSVTLIARAADLPPTSEDRVRQFRTTETYSQLEQEFGHATAERIVMAVYSGWSVERIIGRFVTDDSDREYLLSVLEESSEADRG